MSRLALSHFDRKYWQSRGIWPPVGESHYPTFWFHCFLVVVMRPLFSKLAPRCGGSRSGGFGSRHCRYNHMRPIHLTTKGGRYLHRRRASRLRRPHDEMCAGAHTRQIGTNGSDRSEPARSARGVVRDGCEAERHISPGFIQAVRTPLGAIQSGGYVPDAVLSAH